jgi:hypothetical protein
MSKTHSVKFTKKQVEYLIERLGIDDPNEALDAFIRIMSEENIDPNKAPLYVDKLMGKDGVK